MNNKLFAERIDIALRVNGFKPVDLAKRTGIQEGLISKFRAAKQGASVDSLKAIAEALNVSPEWLMGYDVPMELQSVEPTVLQLMYEKLDPEQQKSILSYAQFLLRQQEERSE